MDLVQPWVLDMYDRELEGLLIKNLVHPSDLDSYLEFGLRIVQRRERKLSQVSRILTMLLQSGAKWNNYALLDQQKTPYHIICDSEGDHHELLDLMIKSLHGVRIDTQDSYKHTALMNAVRSKNVNCVKILIEKGAPLDITGSYQHSLWPDIARLGNIELLKCMINHGIDKNRTDINGLSVLWWVVRSGNVEAVQYLLEQGVSIPNYAPDVKETQCDRCKEKMLIVDRIKWRYQKMVDPCMRSIRCNNLEIIKLLDEYGSPSYKSFEALRHAVIYGQVDVASFLLSRYPHPLNIEYIVEQLGQTRFSQRCTLLTDHYFTTLPDSNLLHITKLLLDHGADPAKQMCAARSVNALMTAIECRNLKVIAQYIRSGVDINFRSYDRTHGKVLPFEASVMRGYHNVAKMLLISGCSCGQFSLNNNREDKVNLKPELKKLMKEWKVQENNVTPLQQRCRSVILNHLSPRADMKIEKLPLPGLLIKLLTITELDVMLDYKQKSIDMFCCL